MYSLSAIFSVSRLSARRLIFSVVFLFALISFAPPAAFGSTPTLGAQLSPLYEAVGAHFWRAEDLLSSQTATRTQRDALLGAPLPESHPAHREYSRCAAAADAFLKLADEHHVRNWMLDPVLYFGGLAHFTLGNYARAALLFARLSPDYKRAVYINDRDPINPELAIPTQPGISKLLFYCRLQALPQNPADALAALKAITLQAGSTLQVQSDYAHWLANRKNRHARRAFDEKHFGGQPDQVRASALPSTPALLQSAWETLLPPATKKNPLAVRDYLRQLGSAPDPGLAALAANALFAVDARVTQLYFAQAQNLLKARNFNGAREKYRQIIAEYPDTPAARKAQAQFPAVTRAAVAYYKAEGQKNFQPVNHIGQPQTKSREYFARLLKEDPNSDYALYYHSRALATENKIGPALAELKSFGTKHPQSPLRPAALFLRGFLLASQKPPDYKNAVALMDEVAKKYPDSEAAPEALFYAGSYLAWQSRFGEAIQRLQQIEKYPKSIRHKWAPPFIAYLQEKQQSGGQWP
jgi:TolA-binding protein